MTSRIHPAVFASIVILLGIASLHADIQSTVVKKSKGKKQPVLVSISEQSVPKVVVRVIRGGSVDIPIVAIPFRPGKTHVKILNSPKHGTLTQVNYNPGKAVVFRYVHDREYSDEEETFTFLVTDSLYNRSGTRQTGRILIRNPHATLVFDSGEKIDFGKVPLGETVSKKVTLSNAYGSTISGALRVVPPWHIDDDPYVVLREGSSKTFTISFSPKTDGAESSRLSFDPETANLPELILHGYGQPPFELTSPAVLKIAKDSPRASIMMKNCTDQAITVAWKGNCSGLEISPLVTMPPNGTAEAWVSSCAEMPPDVVSRRTLKLCSMAYSLPVKLEIAGPRGGVSVELLRGGETLGAIRGEELLLEGVVRNSSETEREVDIRIENPESETKLPPKHLHIPPRSFANFQFSWYSKALGNSKLPVIVSEGEKVVAEDSWQLSVRDRVAPLSPALIPKPHSPARITQTNIPQGGTYLASDNFKAMAVVDTRPIEEKGILMNHLILKWRYFGPEKTVFVVEEKHTANALTDRTGDESENVWKRVEGTMENNPGGVFSIRIPMPYPGIHEYRVYPAGIDQVAIAPVTMEVSYMMFWWPWIRSLLLLVFLIVLLKFLVTRL
jgi:hypothetical protein